MYVDLLLRWLHILSAIVLVGGTIFMRFAYLPAISSDKQQEFQAAVRSRWAKWVAAASGFLLLSGLFNFARILGSYEIDDSGFPGSVYQMVFGIKFLLAFAVFFLASALAGKRTLAERLRQNEKAWLTLNALLAVTVVCLAGLMKQADRRPKSLEGVPQSEASVWSADPR